MTVGMIPTKVEQTLGYYISDSVTTKPRINYSVKLREMSNESRAIL